MEKIIVAIDGPAGAGKSTIAKKVADALGYIYLDTGAMYRAVTLKFLQSKESFSPALVTSLAQKAVISFQRTQGQNQVFLEGVEVTEAIRSQEVTRNVSQVAAVKGVREAMVAAQRMMGTGGGVVLDGRDIGTVVFPNAQVKVFLTASAEVRAQRRYAELTAKGQQVDLAQLTKDIALRDQLDSQREVAPLRCAEDAHYLDSSLLTIAEVVASIIKLCREA